MPKIKEWIKKGEGKTIEFKRTLPDGNHIAKTVIAFSNMAGGKIIIGIEDIIAGRSEIRNKVIARFFKEIEFIEQWGNGIRKMLRLLEQDGLPDPQFRESGLFFKIIIYKKKTQGTTIETTTETTAKTSGENEKIAHKILSEEDLGTSGEMVEEKRTTIETTTKTTAKDSGEIEKTTPTTLSEEDIGTSREIAEATTIETTIETTTETTIKIHGKLLKLIKAKPSIRLTELAERMHLTKDGVWYHLKKLKEAGILNRVGPTKAGYWKINENHIPKSTI